MVKKSAKIRNSKNDMVFIAIVYALGAVFVMICAYPLIYVLSSSFSDPGLISSGKVWLWSRGFQINAYKSVFADKRILTGYTNSLIYSTLGTTINIAATIAAAYPLSRPNLAGKNLLTIFITFTMFFSGGTIPTYLLVRDLQLLNTVWAIVLPGAVSAYNFLIMRNYFQNSVSGELIEAAYVDGASNIGTLLRIIIPVSKPIIAVMVIFYFVGNWNSYFSALLYLSDFDKYPLQMFIREILIKSQSLAADGMDVGQQKMLYVSVQFAVVVVASVPLLLLYPFIQRFMVKGIMIGSIKG